MEGTSGKRGREGARKDWPEVTSERGSQRGGVPQTILSWETIMEKARFKSLYK